MSPKNHRRGSTSERKTMKKPSGEVRLTAYGCTDVGMVRTNNEDNFLLADLSSGASLAGEEINNQRISKRGSLLVVSDGMGGAQAGEVASAMAVETLRNELLKSAASRSASDQLTKAVQRANYIIWREGQANTAKAGMGATLTAALVRDTKAFIAEVGDSRAYLIRSSSIIQVTTDQSLVELLILAGEISREEAEHAPIKNVILQAIGTQPEVKVALTSIELRRGDYLLLCSDGLSNKVTEAEMLKFTLKASSIEMACKQLVELAKRRGGEDNITVIIAQVDGDGLTPQLEDAEFHNSIQLLASFYPTEEDDNKSATTQSLSDPTSSGMHG
ncbi:MAG: Stp1/IreP family PP2C-type Ser/Thr phosphatase [Acidobacteriota bacterium]